MPLTAGTALGTYQIVAQLGAGGMGEVYRARDTKLNREVAIKVLPDLVAGDRDRLARFEREAQLLASLNHPNIAAIYGIEESSGVPALILELVDGPTLAEMLAMPGGRPSIDEAVEMARQIAIGVEAAHDRGIIHRDLKPANVKRTPDGTVKILDFGLAKALADETAAASDLSHSPTVTAAGTRGGVILGTAAYMSPEQARGQMLDERTDIWAFGCILYELLTGRAAFGGPTVSDLLVHVLSSEPDWSALPERTPPPILRLLRRCLEKDRRRRLHAMADARIEVEDAGEVQAGAPVVPRADTRDRWARAGWIAAAVATAAALALAARGTLRPPENGLIDATPQPLTFDTGLTITPAISPDGRLVAYASDRGGRGDLDIWVQQTAGGTPLRLTTDPADEQTPDFSPDGSQIVFRSERDGGGAYIVSTLGGEPRLIAREGRRPRFSPDGSRIAYWTGLIRGGSVSPSATFVIALAGGAPVRVMSDFAVAHDPVWSPDGRALLVTAERGRSQTIADLDWWVAPVDGHDPIATGAVRIPAVRASFSGVPTGYQWRDDAVLFSDGTSLWSLALSADGRVSDAARRLTLGVERQHDLSMSGDERMVFASTSATRVIERVPLTDGGQALQLYTDNRLGEGRMSQTRDGSILVFPRGRDIWMKDLRTGKERFVMRAEGGGDHSSLNATVSPDGERIAYDADSAGYVVETSGGVARRICEACQPHGFLSDGKRLLVSPRLTTAEEPLRLVDVLTGTGYDIIAAMPQVHFARPHASPDDRWLAFVREMNNQNKTFVTRLAPGAPPPPEAWQQVDEPTITGRPAGWSPDSRILYLLLDTDGFRCLWAQNVDASGHLVGKPYAIRHFHGANESNFGTSFGNAITADGFVLDGTRRIGNIWMLAAPRSR